jgi:hypothetical protein
MKKFIGRKDELYVLDKAYKSEVSEFIPIYGRRRVGKSELIMRFLKKKTGIYFVGKKARADLQIKEFLNESSIILKEPLLEGLSVSGWENALTTIVNKWNNNKKRIIIFDEFQWTVEASPELPSVLQTLWDKHWKNNGKIMLILCGSYIGFMEREVLGKKSPLFGRRTAQILLKPFKFQEAGNFHPEYSLTDMARVYFICGGIPWYLNSFSGKCSIDMNIIENLLNPFAPLFQEPDFLLREELRDVNNYYSILMAISAGSAVLTDISAKTGIDSRALNYYLKHLIELGYISKRYPLTSRAPSKRSVRYSLEDPLLRFWFRFIYPNTSYIQYAGGAKTFQERIKPELESFFGYCFERLCREAMPYLYFKKGVNASFQIGEYWNSQMQIDVVGIRDDNWIDAGECKWGKVRSIKTIVETLRIRMKNYPNPQNKTIAGHIFTRDPVKAGKTILADITLHTLEDIYNLYDSEI